MKIYELVGRSLDFRSNIIIIYELCITFKIINWELFFKQLSLKKCANKRSNVLLRQI